MAQTAEKEGIPTAELALRNSDIFQAMQEKLNVSFDRFIRTSDADHVDASIEIWNRMNAAGDIYLDSYSGWYSVRDERFFAEDELEERADGVRYSIETGTPVTWTEEQTYFFRLSAYTERLLAHYAAHPEFIGPDVRRNEVVSFVSGGLRDLSDLADDVRLGRQGARPSRPRHVRVGGRVDQLPHRSGLSRHRLGGVPPVLAGRSAHDRQGHHPVPHRVLAGVPDVGRDRAAAQRVRARLHQRQEARR